MCNLKLEPNSLPLALVLVSGLRVRLGLGRLEDVLDGRRQREVGQRSDLGQLRRLLRLNQLKTRNQFGGQRNLMAKV